MKKILSDESGNVEINCLSSDIKVMGGKRIWIDENENWYIIENGNTKRGTKKPYFHKVNFLKDKMPRR